MSNETTALAKGQKSELSMNVADLTPFEAAAFGGDYSKMSQEQRSLMLAKVHESVGLNPFTGGFQFQTFNGKLVLYASKGVTNQLCKINKLTITATAPVLQSGLLICHATATDPSGRSDTDFGAVPFAESMSPVDRANAMMKVVTKAKRRVVLSLCGLGMLDESEFDTQQEARPRTQPQPKVNINAMKPVHGCVVEEPASEKPKYQTKPFELECRALIKELYDKNTKDAINGWLKNTFPGVSYADMQWEKMHGQLLEAKKTAAQPQADAETGEITDEPAFNDDPKV